MKHYSSDVWSEVVLSELSLARPEGELVCLGFSTAPGPEPGVCTLNLPQLYSPHGPGPLDQTSVTNPACGSCMHPTASSGH